MEYHLIILYIVRLRKKLILGLVLFSLLCEFLPRRSQLLAREGIGFLLGRGRYLRGLFLFWLDFQKISQLNCSTRW